MKYNQDSHISDDLIEKLVASSNLPSLPSVAVKIINASKDPDIGLSEVATIISSDPAISSKILRIANSPLYSQRRAVNNLREALTLLGFNAALTISLSFSLFHSLKNSDSKNCNHNSYWKRSILSAEIARLLGSRLKLSKLEDLYLASLLQDIGILVLDNISNSPYELNDDKCLNHAERVELEQKLLNLDHSCIGAWLLESWNFPEKLVTAINNSHLLKGSLLNGNLPDSSLFKDRDVTSRFEYCLNFSGCIADIWLEDDSEELLIAVQEAANVFLELSVSDFVSLKTDINNQLAEISALFEIDFNDEAERGKLLDEAHDVSLERSLYFIKQSEENRKQIESITEHVKDIEKESQLDHLTQIFNRKYIDRVLADEYENANRNRWPLSLAFIDLDEFKIINDTYGHLAGDKMLVAIADFFANNIRETDTLARYGGDEFILMLPGATSYIAQGMLTRLMELLKENLEVEFDGDVLNLTVSIGVASHMDANDFDTLKDFIRAADKALYKAKEAGRNCLAVY